MRLPSLAAGGSSAPDSTSLFRTGVLEEEPCLREAQEETQEEGQPPSLAFAAAVAAAAAGSLQRGAREASFSRNKKPLVEETPPPLAGGEASAESSHRPLKVASLSSPSSSSSLVSETALHSVPVPEATSNGAASEESLPQARSSESKEGPSSPPSAPRPPVRSLSAEAICADSHPSSRSHSPFLRRAAAFALEVEGARLGLSRERCSSIVGDETSAGEAAQGSEEEVARALALDRDAAARAASLAASASQRQRLSASDTSFEDLEAAAAERTAGESPGQKAVEAVALIVSAVRLDAEKTQRRFQGA